MRIGTVHKLINLLLEAFEQLDVHAEPRSVEYAAVMVHKAMTLQARNYHTLEHVFNFIDPPNPIRTLAAMYHDLVYYQVDRGFLPEIREMIAPYILEKDGQVYLREAIPSRDRTFNITLAIFGLPTQAYISPFEGLNEFLSALVMNKQLEDIVPETDRFKISVCIEGTIPFRSRDYFNQLANRVHLICKQYQIQLSEVEIEESIRMAVNFANRDVESFAEKEPEKFLSATWKLLPETNEALRAREVYSIREFRLALENMEAFLSSLNPENVFHCYQDAPPVAEYQAMEVRVRNNLTIARKYLQVKLLAQALLEALAELTGGDAPQALFTGDIPDDNTPTQRLEYYLPEASELAIKDKNEIVYRLLKHDQRGEEVFDVTTSPLALFMYSRLGKGDMERLFALSQEMFAGTLSPDQFLGQFDPAIVAPIAEASAFMVPTRKNALNRFVR